MRSLRSILSRVNQIAERAQSLGSGMDIVESRLLAARERRVAGLAPSEPEWWSKTDDELRQRARGSGEAMKLTERLIGARKRLKQHRAAEAAEGGQHA